jgi:hypothetical protein
MDQERKDEDGPEFCCLTQILQKFENKEIKMNQILKPMLEDCKYKALELSDLFTNKIEEAGFESKETEKALSGNLENSNQKKEQKATQLFNLLKETFSISKTPRQNF